MILDRPIAKTEIEAYRELVDEMDFDWIPIYLKREKIKTEIREIQAELSGLSRLAPGNEDLRKNAHTGLKELEAESIKRLAGYLNESRRSQNPFNRVDRMKEILASFYLTPEMIDAALDILVEPENCISIEQKQKERIKLEKSLEKKKAELEKNSPPEHFLWQNGQPTLDLCANYERKWRSMQGRFSTPADALGFELSSCKESEQQAWRDLRIRSAMNERAKLAPIPA